MTPSLTLRSTPIYLNRSASLSQLLNQSLSQARALTNSIPPGGLVLLSCFSVQLGMATAKSLFESLGAIGAAFICNSLATLFLLTHERHQLTQLSRNYRHYGAILLLGVCIAGMTLAIYSALDRIPMGIASTLEFVGPLGVALIGSRPWLDLVWVVLAAAGVVLLAPFSGTVLDPLGIGLALLSGGFWAGYILLSAPASRLFPKGVGLALSMSFASILLAFPGIAQAGIALFSPVVPLVAVAAAILGKVVPYSLEYTALKRMPPRVFGVLMSIEPAIAALVGFLALGEQLNLQSLIAIVLVTVAAMGATLMGRQA